MKRADTRMGDEDDTRREEEDDDDNDNDDEDNEEEEGDEGVGRSTMRGVRERGCVGVREGV